MEAMIFAAGLGTRLQEYTKNKPKALVEVEGKSLLEINIQRLISFGFNHIVVNVHHYADQIIDFLNSHKFNANIYISNEQEKLLDTGGGLQKALPLFSGKNPILIHNVDVLSKLNLLDLYNYHIKQSTMATLAVSDRNTSRYFLFHNNTLVGWRNTKTGEEILSTQVEVKQLAFSGIHMVNPELLQSVNLGDKFSMTDLYVKACNKSTINAFVHNPADWLDVGTPETLQKAVTFLHK